MVKVEISHSGRERQYEVNCPRCGSKNVHVDKRGYSFLDGLCGGICFGPLGLLCGGMDSKQLEGQCLSCGKKFNVNAGLSSKWKQDNKPHNQNIECPHCNEEFTVDLKKTSSKHTLKCPHCDERVSLSDEEEEEPKSKSHKFCKECGKKIKKTSKFCEHCGEKHK